jgi:di/tricarboxylate transporter
VSDISLVFAVVGATIALFVWNRLPVVVVAVASALVLWATGLVTLEQSLAGFSDAVVVFVAALMIVTAALESTGVTAWIGQHFERLVRGEPRRLQLFGMAVVAGLSPLINASGALATALPVVMMLAVRLGESPGRHLMPLAFAATAGSHLALTGAPKNVLIADAAYDLGTDTIGFFEFAIVGLPMLAGTMAIVLLLGERLLPRRQPQSLPPDLGDYARVLVEQYRLARDTFRLHVQPGSPLHGRPAAEPDPASYPGLVLVSASSPDGSPRRGSALATGDVLVLRGPLEAATAYAAAHALELHEASVEETARELINRRAGVVEAVIPPRSEFIGRTVFPGMLTRSGDLLIRAVQRRGENVSGEVTLEAGDHVLVQGDWTAIDARQAMRGFLVVDRPEELRRQLVPLGVGARTMLAITAAMVVLIAAGLTPPVVAALLAAGAVLALGIVKVRDAFRSVNWTTVVLLAGMMPLSTALYETGAAQLVAEQLVAVTGTDSPHLLLAGMFALAVALGVVLSNTATCLILIPVAVLAADATGVSPLPVLMALSVATSASFLTPLATAVNAMVMEPAGYRFGDYWSIGLPLTAWFGVVAVWLVPLVWRF